MDRLVECSCGHPIGSHETIGCLERTPLGPCGCERTSDDVIHFAIEASKSQWSSGASSAESSSTGS